MSIPPTAADRPAAPGDARPPATRLAYLVTQYPAVSHTFIHREIVGLRRRGLEIDVASVNPPDRPVAKLSTAEAAEEARTFYIKRIPPAAAVWTVLAHAALHPVSFLGGWLSAVRLGGAAPRRALKFLFYFAEAIVVGRWMRSQGKTHLHVHFATSAANVGLLASRMFDISLSLTVHGPEEFDDVSWHHLPDKVAAARFLCCIGYFAKTQMLKLSPPACWDKIEVSPLGVPLADFQALEHKAEPGSGIEIVCVARLAPVKGHRILLAAVRRLAAQGAAVRLRLVGGGPEREPLERLVAGYGLQNVVKFEGAMNPDRVREMLAQADIFALPSFDEGIPVSLMEAMAMEIPCVSTYVGGIPELIRDGIDGFLISPADEEALAHVLQRLSDDPALRRRIGEAGRARVTAKYNLDVNLDRLAAIFARYIGESEAI